MSRKLEVNYQLVHELDGRIESLICDDDIEEEVNGTLDVLNCVTSTQLKVETFFSERRCDERSNHSQAAGDSIVDVEDEARTVDVKKRISVKLPRLEINKFNGQPSTWQSFWSQYSTAIHDNKYLGKAEKFVYLKSLLLDDAQRAVSGLQLSNENYDVAIDVLKQRFGRRDVVVNAHMNRLLSLQYVRSSSDTKALRKMYDVCEVEIRSLESLGVSSTMFGTLLCPVIMKALPQDIALDYNMKKTSTNDWEVNELLDYLRKVVEARERTAALANERKDYSASTKTEDRYQKHSDRQRHQSAAALQLSPEQMKCLFCEMKHYSFRCQLDPRLKSRQLTSERRCYMCFKRGHTSMNCSTAVLCEKCNRRHHMSICFAGDVDEQRYKNTEKAEKVVSSTTLKNGPVLLQTVSAKLDVKSNPSVRILLDGGSETTFILKEVSRRYRMPVIKEDNVNVYTFGNDEPTSTIRRIVEVQLRDIEGQQLVIKAAETDTITAAKIRYPPFEVREAMRRRNFVLSDAYPKGPNRQCNIAILIGSDYFWKVCTGRVERITSSMVAIETIFGWCVQGPSSEDDHDNIKNVMSCNAEDKLSTMVRAFWDLEAIGIVDEKRTDSLETNEVMMRFKENIKYVDGRYQVTLPWNEKVSKLESNFEVAKQRLKYLARKFQRDELLYLRYKSVINEQLQQGISEKVIVVDHVDEPIYYLPHQAVIREDKVTTKLRVVFDASSHREGKLSLNDCLHSGPNLVPDLISVLLNFRRKKFAFMADIKKAFLQIGVKETDRDSIRFLWFSNQWQPGKELIFDEYRMTRVVFGATCSPFLLAATIRHHIAKYSEKYPNVVEEMRKYLYVDDFIGSVDNETLLRELQSQACNMMRDAGMELVKWSTNSRAVNNEWNEVKEYNELPISIDVSSEKVLGLVWKNVEDEFTFNVQKLIDFLADKRDTKRNVLKAVSRVFDPLGFLNPFTIRVKCLFQRLWEKGLHWDDELEAEDAKEWQKWCMDLRMLEDVEVKRCLEGDNVKERQIHIFCDASTAAYGAVAYMRVTTVDDFTKTTFICSKARVAPLKKITLPRLELMGAVLSARLKNYLENQIVDAKFYFWSDAMIVLHWIRGSSKKWKPFVGNRIGEIHMKTIPEDWSHCSGLDNPADKLTRGMKMKDLLVDDIWWHGPSWLKQKEDEWPRTKLESIDDSTSEELKKTFVSHTTIDEVRPIFDETKFSCMQRLLRVTSWIFRFIHNCKSLSKSKDALTVDEINFAEIYWIKASQGKHYLTEIRALKSCKLIPSNSIISSFNCFLDQNEVLRIGGRLQYSDVDEYSKQPVVIPRESHFAKLVIVDAHEKVKHMATQGTLAQIRSRYWIPRGRQLVKSILRHCNVCLRLSGKPFDEEVAPLPADRTSMSKPFQVIGIDFAGPLIERKGGKVYILLITCAVTRAVHLELVTSMNTEAVIMALRRFIGRRGVPSTIYSDNARTFKRVNVEISSLLQSTTSTTWHNFLSVLKIKWKYIVERSPWWGGFWERMVRTVKSTLKKTVGKASMNIEELSTILIECEAVINSRPLSYVYVDEDIIEPLTPSHLVNGFRLTSLPSTKDNEVGNVAKATINSRWRYRQKVSEHYWRRWQKEYLLELRSAMEVKRKTSKSPKVGDVVLVKEDNVPRQKWNLGKIVDVVIGRDQKVRACSVRLGTGAVVSRPIQRLFPLEVTIDGTSSVSMGGSML